MVLLYFDVLGMKARWMTGVDEVLAVYRRLERLVADVVRRSGHTATGGVQSDAVALTFPDVHSAVAVGSRLFARCFSEATEQDRMWLRGVIVACEGTAADLVREAALNAGDSALTVRHFSRGLLDAVNIEQRFKGPRLLIDEQLVDQRLRDRLAIPLGDRFMVPLKHLQYSLYPESDHLFQDVLYLVPSSLDLDGAAVRRRSLEVNRRMRWSSSRESGAPAEFAHVSALTVNWMETEAILHDIQRRARLPGD